jgi:hypothetical protein
MAPIRIDRVVTGARLLAAISVPFVRKVRPICGCAVVAMAANVRRMVPMG